MFIINFKLMKKNFSILSPKCLAGIAIVFYVAVAALAYLLVRQPRYTGKEAKANAEMYDACIPKAIVLMGYMNGVQLDAVKTGDGTYIMYCGVVAVKDKWVQPNDYVLRSGVYPAMQEYLADIKTAFLENLQTKLEPNQMAAMMVVCSRVGVGNFSKRLEKLQHKDENGTVYAVSEDALIKEFFYCQSKSNVEIQQYFWTLGQVFADELKVRDLYELPAMSYRYLDVDRLYTSSGRPRKQRGLLLRYTNLKAKSIKREHIIPYAQISKLY